MRKINIQKYQ